MADVKVEVAIKCTLRVDGGKRTCPWELKATSIEEAAAMHRMHIEGLHA